MKKLSNKKLSSVVGGITLSYSLINSFVRAIEVALDVGRSFGTAIRRIGSKNVCGVR